MTSLSLIFYLSLTAQLVKNPPAMQEILVRFLDQEDPLEKVYATHSSILELPCGSAGKESTYSVTDLGSIPGLGRSPGEGKGYPHWYSGLENTVDCMSHGVTKSRTQLSDFTFTFHFHALEKEMATHTSVLAWRIPGTGEPGGLPCMGSHRVGHD